MIFDKPLEIERKFLCHMPSATDIIEAGGVPYRLCQTYLTHGPNGENRRVRQSIRGEDTTYTYTQKTRKTPVTCIEEERVITEEEYHAYLTEAREGSAPVQKTRWKVPYGGHTLELDLYPFWQAYAILEVELAHEDEEILLPSWLSVLREVTEDARYKNTAIADWLYLHPDTPLPIQ